MRTPTSESGFTIVELMVASMITLDGDRPGAVDVLAGDGAQRDHDAGGRLEPEPARRHEPAGARSAAGRARNIPTGGISIPSGAGATAIRRPSPPCTVDRLRQHDLADGVCQRSRRGRGWARRSRQGDRHGHHSDGRLRPRRADSFASMTRRAASPSCPRTGRHSTSAPDARGLWRPSRGDSAAHERGPGLLLDPRWHGDSDITKIAVAGHLISSRTIRSTSTSRRRAGGTIKNITRHKDVGAPSADVHVLRSQRLVQHAASDARPEHVPSAGARRRHRGLVAQLRPGGRRQQPDQRQDAAVHVATA